MKKILQMCLLLAATVSLAQTEIDGVMMGKGYLCSGIVYESSSWKEYWEGIFKRENLNFGIVSAQKVAVNFNYGISKANTNNSNLLVVCNNKLGVVEI